MSRSLYTLFSDTLIDWLIKKKNNSRVYLPGVPEKMSLSEIDALLTKGTFFGHPV